MDLLEEIKARAVAATPGPWKLWNSWSRSGSGMVYVNRIGAEDRNSGIVTIDDADMFGSQDDFAFIAHAREDIPRLLAEIERLRGLVAKVEYDSGLCPWCDIVSDHPHHSDCPAFSAPGVVR